MQEPSEQPIVYFDAHCRLCRASLRFIARRDPRRRFAFRPLQSPTGQAVAKQAGLDPDTPGSLVLQQDGHSYLRSDAALRIAARLRPPWPALTLLRIVPRGLRDRLYALVARHRYRWFGTSADLPTPDRDPDIRDRMA